MRVQRNKETGEYRVDPGDGLWIPARMQRNRQTGDMRILARGQAYPYKPGQGQEADPPQTARPEVTESGVDAFKWGLGMGTRDLLEGMGSLTEPVMAPLNTVNAWLGGDGNYFKTNAGRELANALNLPKSEGLGAGIRQGAASALGGIGAGAMIQTAPALAKMLTDTPILQILSGGAAGGARKRRVFPFGGVARFFPRGAGQKSPAPVGKFPRALPNEKSRRFPIGW